MHLIIDGYNVIRRSPRLSQLDAQDLERGREALLELLGAYRRRRWQHTVTVVFDGWGAGEYQESRDLYRGMTVIFSRRGERADEVIKRLLARERGRAVVVSSDRDLQAAAERVGAVWVTAGEFERRCLAADMEEEETYLGEGRTTKKGPARRAPKRQRQRQQRLRKL
ncbi:MAG: NYN domain-containing protein [candidate division KSB1 bacterium]|nr:NYN domain-containing protein [candidate division KSB1 bacterium]